ncbi:Sh3 and multiple ankyrin repeat domains protein 3, partial [Plakobranchus ocellatus]
LVTCEILFYLVASDLAPLSPGTETPLTIAVTLGKSKCREVIITLVSGGAHLDFRNRQGQTALHRSAIVGNAEAIRTLLDLGASPDVKDALDLTPLYYSVCNEDSVQECSHMLLHERARIGMCDANGWYEIHQVSSREAGQ